MRAATRSEVISFVEGTFGIPFGKLATPSRTTPIVFARSIAMYLLYNNAGMTSTRIGVLFGRDHSTVLHNKRNISDAIFFEEKKTVEIINSFETGGAQ